MFEHYQLFYEITEKSKVILCLGYIQLPWINVDLHKFRKSDVTMLYPTRLSSEL